MKYGEDPSTEDGKKLMSCQQIERYNQTVKSLDSL